jgi:hypothetical protein
MTPIARRAVLAVLAASLLGASSAATSTGLRDLPQSYLMSSAGMLVPVRAGVTYGASQFPIPVRLTAPDRSWVAAQWRSGDEYFAGGKPPNYGWIHLAHSGGSSAEAPRGMVTVMTGYGSTPSVAATVDVLRTRGRGAIYDATSRIRLAGFSGVQFDGRIVGGKNHDHVGHYFVPFSPPHQSAKYFPDEYPVYGDVFRIMVLNVRSKTVVVIVENVALEPESFPAFLSKAEEILKTLTFPA